MKFNPLKIKIARKSIGLSHERLLAELAKNDLAVSRTTLDSWERGDTAPDVDKLPVICKVLKKPIGYFFNNQ